MMRICFAAISAGLLAAPAAAHPDGPPFHIHDAAGGEVIGMLAVLALAGVIAIGGLAVRAKLRTRGGHRGRR